MTVQSFLKLLKENNFTNSEILIKEKEIASISAENGKLENYDISSTKKYSIKASRGTHNMSIISTYLHNDLIKELLINIGLIDQETKIMVTTDTENNNTTSEKEEIDPKHMLNEIITLSIPTTKEAYLTSVGYEESSVKTSYYNDCDVVKEKNSKRYMFLVESASRNDKDKTATQYSYQIGPDKKEWNLQKMKSEAEEESKLQLDSHTISSRKTAVILEKNAMSQLFHRYIEIFSGEMIRKNTSPLLNKRGEKLFSSKLNIIEDPLRKDLPGYSPFDDEGISTSKKYLVKDGKIVDFLYDNKSASKENRTSTGNYYGGIATRNAYINPGTPSLKELITNMENGVVITEINGVGSGVNTTSGDFSLQAKGYLIENKLRTDSVNLITISGNIIELLNNIKEIGNDLYFRDIEAGAPSILFDIISISGSIDACVK